MEDEGLTPEARRFFRNLKREEEIDDSTFNEWKIELEKDLPEFWKTMNQKFSK